MRTPAGSRRVIVACSTGLFLVTFDNSALLVLLTQIGASRGVDTGGLQWLTSMIPLSSAAALIGAGSAGDHIGKRWSLILGLLLWGCGAISLLIPGGLALMLFARAVQGCGSAFMLPNAFALLNNNVSEAAARNRAVSATVTLGSSGMIIGFLAAGVVSNFFSWEWLFVAQAALAIFGIILVRRLREVESRDASHTDVRGILFAAICLAALCWTLIGLGRQDGRDYRLAIGALVALVSGWAFVSNELARVQPALNLRLFRVKLFASTNVASLLYNAAVSGVMFIVALTVSSQFDLRPFETGLLLLALVGLMPVGSAIGARFARSVSAESLIAVGAGGLVVVFIGTSATTNSGSALSLWPLAVTGMLAGLLYSAETVVILSAVPGRQSASGLAVISAVRQVGSVLGIAGFGTLAEILRPISEWSHVMFACLAAAASLGAAAALGAWIGARSSPSGEARA